MKRTAISIYFSVMMIGLALGEPSSIRVVDAETGNGLESDIYHESDSGSRRRVGVTKADGRISRLKSGKPGERYLAVNEAYNLSKVECPLRGEQVIRMRKTKFVSDYIAKAEFFAVVEKPAAAALQYQLAANILKANRTTESPAYKAREAFAEVVDVHKPFESGDRPGVKKSSASFTEAVADFQLKIGLSPTGKLDLATLERAAMIEAKDQPMPREPMLREPESTARNVKGAESID